MRFANVKARLSLILTPIIVILFMFISTYISIYWYQESLYKKLEDNSYQDTLMSIYKTLDKQIDALIDNNKKIFSINELRNNKSDDFIYEYIKKNIKNTNRYEFILKLNDDNKSMEVLHSSLDSIKAGEILVEKSYSLIDKKTIDYLLKNKRYYVQGDYDGKNTLYKLFKYYPQSKIVVGIGVIREKHKVYYDRFIKTVTGDIDKTRNITLIIGAIFSLFGAFLVSFLLWRISLDFKKSELNLEKSNEKLKILNQTLEKQLLIDTPTELFNIRALHKDIDNMQFPKLILVDIDDYRRVTEYFDQIVLEKILLYMRDTLLKFCREYSEFNMKAYRTGSSQFALLEEGPLDMERYEFLASELVKNFKGVRVKVQNEEGYVEFSCTIGFSLEEINVYETAITALRRAVEKEKDYLCYFKILGEREEFKNQIIGANFIKKALENDTVVPYFQPVFDRDGKLTKHECLVRIIGEDGTIVSPYWFLEISRRIKRYVQIEKELIRKSLDAIRETDRVISINISSHDMTDGEVSHFIIEEILKYDKSKQVIFEILESENIENIENVDRIVAFIKKAKAMGVKIAIDDFGSGYSNFSYMLTLEPDYIKIDGSLIKNIDKSEKSYAIVSAIMVFAKKLGILTIAEFVHNKEVYDICMELGIDEFQGFYLGEPRPEFHT